MVKTVCAAQLLQVVFAPDTYDRLSFQFLRLTTSGGPCGTVLDVMARHLPVPKSRAGACYHPSLHVLRELKRVRREARRSTHSGPQRFYGRRYAIGTPAVLITDTVP